MALEGASQDDSREACASLEDGVPAGGPPNAVGVVEEAPLETIVRSSFSARLANASPRRLRLPDQLMLGSYVLSQEWDCPSADTVALGLEATQEIIDHWSPFNKRESLVAHMRGLYPILLRVRVAACAEEYSIPFPGYLDRKSFQCVVEDGMLIRNHDFNESAELVCFDF